jgi:ribosomal protein L40E
VEWKLLVYCVNCGTTNEEDAKYCTKCGANLDVSREKRLERREEDWGEDFGRRAEEWGEDFGRRAEEWGKQMEREFKNDCFGLPHGGTIVGILFGIIIIILGFAWLANINIWNYLGPIAAIIIGILIITGVAYRLIRR